MTTKRDSIAAELRRRINAGELPRGAHIAQSALAAEFATSITPVREALGVLQAEGVLTSEPRRGVRVATADLAQVRTVYLLRQLLEPYAMQRAIWGMSPRDLHEVEEYCARMEASERANDPIAFSDLNRRFHFAFFERCGDEGLRDEIAALWHRYPWDILRVLGYRRAEAEVEHREIVAAARAGDLERVAEATRQHTANSYLALAEHLSGERGDDPFPVTAVVVS
ncbi:GntR family transcriptional regulator [Sinomonas notoginsengisoli]|uniref:GntR family transcriptional regulator n=1 Tax=Sinomonas notoginsengisoli TaxID=1457311 RepID=UPI001F3B90D8|nr:GntR family transcriptional regulator [Sinomonas notoginsengisoli]